MCPELSVQTFRICILKTLKNILPGIVLYSIYSDIILQLLMLYVPTVYVSYNSV